ncbi:MAG: hypothetical protein GX383_11900 [Clostridium sp.]|jgi:hypothetical protein|nr:hypothetical protein [Clostridium sp.]
MLETVFKSITNTFQETLVVLDGQGKIKSKHEGVFKSGDIIKRYNDNTFVLRFNDDGITVSPLLKGFSTSNVPAD